MIKYVFLDLDDTILDFHKAESHALKKTLETIGITPSEQIIKRYSEINLSCNITRKTQRRYMSGFWGRGIGLLRVPSSCFVICTANIGCSSPQTAR